MNIVLLSVNPPWPWWIINMVTWTIMLQGRIQDFGKWGNSNVTPTDPITTCGVWALRGELQALNKFNSSSSTSAYDRHLLPPNCTTWFFPLLLFSHFLDHKRGVCTPTPPGSIPVFLSPQLPTFSVLQAS